MYIYLSQATRSNVNTTLLKELTWQSYKNLFTVKIDNFTVSWFQTSLLARKKGEITWKLHLIGRWYQSHAEFVEIIHVFWSLLKSSISYETIRFNKAIVIHGYVYRLLSLIKNYISKLFGCCAYEKIVTRIILYQ